MILSTSPDEPPPTGPATRPRLRRHAFWLAPVTASAVALLALGAGPATADDDVAPAPPSIGADVPLTYFGPAPSEVQKELVGPVELLRSGEIDVDAGTVTLPLYLGSTRNGREVWYVLTDTTDRAAADALGLNFSGKLANAVAPAVRDATLQADATLRFSRGAVDFAPELRIVPGEAPNQFPPAVAEPGSVGDRFYAPLVRVTNAPGTPVYNAPVVAFDVGADALEMPAGEVDHAVVHDKVVAISAAERTVTLRLTPGFSFAKPVLYLSLDASEALPAALEGSTLAPGMAALSVGGDDSAFSAVERLFTVVNGPAGAENPQRQGLSSALGDEGVSGPLNLFGGIPTVATDYSPMWDLNVGEWTQEAIDSDYRSRMIDEFQYLGMVERGFITGPGGAEFGSSGLVVNCPVVMRFL